MDVIRLAAWVLACFVFVILLRDRPTTVLSAVVVLRILVPSGAGGLLLGDWPGNQALHPATVLLLVHLGTALPARGAAVADEFRARSWWYLGAVLVSFMLSVQATAGSGPTSMLGLTNAVLSPVVFFVLLRIHERETPGTVRSVVLVFLATMVIVALLVVVQTAAQTGAPWSLRDPSFVSSGRDRFRPRGTLDSPLDLGFAAAVAIPLTSFLQRGHVRIVVAGLLLAAIVMSASRIPTVLALLGVAWIVSRSLRDVVAVITALSSTAIGTALALGTGLLDGILQRFNGSDGSSAAARDRAVRYALEHVWDHVFAGGGWGAAWGLKGTVLRTSLENSYAILAYDLGLVTVLFLLLLQLAPVCSRFATPEARLAATTGVVLGFCYSGLVTMGAASTVLWLALATCLQHPSMAGAAVGATWCVRDGRPRHTRSSNRSSGCSPLGLERLLRSEPRWGGGPRLPRQSANGPDPASATALAVLGDQRRSRPQLSRSGSAAGRAASASGSAAT